MERVLYVANGPNIGGGARVLMQLMSRLDHDRFQPSLVVPGPGPLYEWALDRGIPCHVLSAGKRAVEGRVRAVQNAMALLPFATGSRVIHAEAPTCYPGTALAARLVRAVRVCHIQTPPPAGQLEWCFRGGLDAAITVYGAQAAEIASRLPHGAQLTVIPNGIETDVFTPLSADEASANRRWRFGARHVVVMVGQLSEVKGYPTFLRAAAIVGRTLDSCAFVCVGDDPLASGYRQTLEALAHDLGISEQVKFVGWQDDVREIVAASDLVVMSSTAEGLPLAILEAMACARPVVATSVNGIPEAVLDGKTGLLVAPGRPQELADAIHRVLRDRGTAAAMGAGGRERVEQHFSVERVVADVEALYTRLLKTRTAHRHDELEPASVP